jgi:hypothetical protein
MNTAAKLSSGHEAIRLFEPDTLAPEQFYATLRRSHFADPERRLMAALLEDALSCLARDPLRCSRRQRKAFDEAHEWVSAAESEDWIFSFANVCETLGFDPGYVRRGLTRWSAQTRSDSGALRLKKYRSGARRRRLRLRSTG